MGDANVAPAARKNLSRARARAASMRCAATQSAPLQRAYLLAPTRLTASLRSRMKEMLALRTFLLPITRHFFMLGE